MAVTSGRPEGKDKSMPTIIDEVERQQDAEVAAALKALETVASETPLRQVVKELTTRFAISDRAVREAVIQLLYRGDMHLTDDRRLVRHSRLL